ncbi:MAG: hypothetical protein AAFX85_20175, partial [Pseudomonadota bacterium]
MRATSRELRRPSALVLALGLVCAAGPATAFRPDVTPGGLLDVRLVIPSAETVAQNGGFGKGPYGRGSDGSSDTPWQAEELAVFARAQLAPPLMASVHLQSVEGQLLDVVESYIRYRPVSTSRVRFAVKAGAFFPRLSFENEGVAWSNLYTLTNSAANTWVAEEVRHIGIDAQVEHRGRTWKTSLTAGPAFASDRSGVALSYRGFVFNDRNVGLFGEIDVPGNQFRLPMGAEPFHEIDGRPGISAGVLAQRRDATRLAL